jgi:hypothetical protein
MKTKTLLLAALAAGWASYASAAVVVAPYDGVGLGEGDPVASTYSGIGLEHDGAFAAISGGTFAFENEPSPDTVMYYTSAATINIAAGFDTGFSFYYSQSSAPISSARVYAGLDGTGDLLGVIELDQNWKDGGCQPGNDIYCNWDVGQTAFGGTALSVVFDGAASAALFDNVTFGSTTPVPLPAAVWLLGSGLLGFAAVRRRRGES